MVPRRCVAVPVMPRPRGVVPAMMAVVPVAVVVTAVTMVVATVTMTTPVMDLHDRRRIAHGAQRDGTGGCGRRYTGEAATREQSEAEGSSDKYATHNLLLGTSEEA